MQVAAVFDVGLRAASPKTIHGMLPLEISEVSLDQVKCHIHKLKLHHHRSLDEMRGGQCPKLLVDGYYHDDGGGANAQQHTCRRFQHNQSGEVERRVMIVQAKNNIRKQAKMIGQSIIVLADFQREVEDTMGRQHQIYDMLRFQLQHLCCFSVDTVTVDSLARPEKVRHSLVRRLDKPQPYALLPQRAQMEKEMQDHIDMHRTMVLHMDSQLAQFDSQGNCIPELNSLGKDPGLEGQVSDWNVLGDIVEEQLFEFLKD